jgi:hypothetical protein
MKISAYVLNQADKTDPDNKIVQVHIQIEEGGKYYAMKAEEENTQQGLAMCIAELCAQLIKRPFIASRDEPVTPVHKAWGNVHPYDIKQLGPVYYNEKCIR